MSIPYRSEIDGLRAIAVLPVIIFHAGFDTFSGGFVGVDVFFVISGYLITSILITEMADDRFSLVNFYERRARRILPALFFVVACSIPVAWLVLLPTDLRDFSNSLMAVASFSSNILFWQESDYFDTASELKPLLHTWSLAVEEQFYILFPLVLMAMWRFGRSTVVWSLGGVFVLSLLAAQWGSHAKPAATFYLLPTRAWELLIGSLAAFHMQKPLVTFPRGINNAASGLGLMAILVSIFAFDETTPFPSLYATLPTFGAVLIILFAQAGTVVQRVLSQRAFVGIGLISYSLYLWHQPVLALYRNYAFDVSRLESVIALAVTGGLSYLTFRYVERPFRHKSRINRRDIFAFSGAGLALMMIFGLSGLQAERTTSHIASYQPDRSVLRGESWQILEGLSDSETYRIKNDRSEFRSWYTPGDDRVRVLVVGNSHSKDLFNVLYHSETARAGMQLARFGVEIADIDQAFFELPNYRDADVVVFSTRYREAGIERIEQLSDRITAEGKLVVLTPSIFEFFDTNRYTLADMFVLQCERRANCDIPALVSDINRAYYNEFVAGPADTPYRRTALLFQQIAERNPAVVTIDKMAYVCDADDQVCHAIDEDLNKFFYDYGHHTLAGAKFFAAQVDAEGWLDPVLRALATR